MTIEQTETEKRKTHIDPLIVESLQTVAKSHLSEMPDDAGFQERISLFAQLENMRRKLEDALDRTKKRAEGMKEHLLEEMVLHDINNIGVRDLIVFSREDRWVRKKSDKDGVTTEMICEALTEIGRGDMVNDGYSAASLKSLVIEIMAENDEIPGVLSRLLNIGSKINLVTQKR